MQTKDRFVLVTSPNGMPAVEMRELSSEKCQIVRRVMGNTYTDSDDYKAHRDAHPFLQGYDEKSGWILIEFWTNKCPQMFIDYLNRQVFGQ